MKRSALVISVCVVLMSLAAVAQIESFPGLILTDMQLISQESLPHWTPRWTGPIQAATIAAWFAEHGYPALMQDYNGDGLIDELDTIELADIFGRGSMAADSERGTTDVRLVLGLAQYIADHYPNEFVLKIYDESFQAEFASQGPAPFDPHVIPGIELVLKGEPSLEAYENELYEGEGVIVGLEEEPGRNTYLSGRSFLLEQTPDGSTPVDFAWAEEDRWASGHQGQVLESLGKMDPGFFVEYRGRWTLVEFMLALSPVEERRGVPSNTYGCPEDAIAYHVTTTSTRYGDVQVEECVLRDGDLDTYIWVVTNISYLVDGCGLCSFVMPNPFSLLAVSHWEFFPWIYSDLGNAWLWWVPAGWCGLLPGSSAVFAVTVPGPTADTVVGAGVGRCPPSGSLVLGTVFSAVETTGPGEQIRCPDLAVLYRDHSCVCDPIDGACTLTVWATIVNVGSAPVTAPFDVLLMSPAHPGGDALSFPSDAPGSLPFNPGDTWDVELSFTFPMGGPLCPTPYKVIVDPVPPPNGMIAECDESNNILLGEEFCYCPDDDGSDACCLPDGSCVELTAPECERYGGEFHPGADCVDVQCPQDDDGSGACCLSDGTCVELTASQCVARGGVEFHPGADCVDVQCPPEGEDCPDLVGVITLVVCTCSGGDAITETQIIGTDPKSGRPIYGELVVGYEPIDCTVRVNVTVTNIGSAGAGPSSLSVTEHTHSVSSSTSIGALPGGGGVAMASVSLSYAIAVEDCQNFFDTLNLELIVDSLGAVNECDEDNNSFETAHSCYCGG